MDNDNLKYVSYERELGRSLEEKERQLVDYALSIGMQITVINGTLNVSSQKTRGNNSIIGHAEKEGDVLRSDFVSAVYPEEDQSLYEPKVVKHMGNDIRDGRLDGFGASQGLDVDSIESPFAVEDSQMGFGNLNDGGVTFVPESPFDSKGLGGLSDDSFAGFGTDTNEVSKLR